LCVMLKASAMQAVERITAFARCRCTALASMGDASQARVLPIPGRVLALHIRFHQLTLCPERKTRPSVLSRRSAQSCGSWAAS
jgi:hypothetical protein